MTEYRVKGAFFENVKDSGPAFTGFVEIDGIRTAIALWPKRSAAGANYLQVSEDKKKSGNKVAGTSPPSPSQSPFKPRKPLGNDPPGNNPDMDDDIPF